MIVNFLLLQFHLDNVVSSCHLKKLVEIIKIIKYLSKIFKKY